MELVETRGADDYWEAKVSLFGSARKPEREITETFEVHAEAKEQCLRIAAHKALGRLVCRYSARLEGTVYKEMTNIFFQWKHMAKEVQAYSWKTLARDTHLPCAKSGEAQHQLGEERAVRPLHNH